MSRRMKFKKNRRMNQFILKYWCLPGRHLAPANQMHTVIAAELAEVPKDWPEGQPRFLGEHAVRACEHHMFTHDLVKLGMPS